MVKRKNSSNQMFLSDKRVKIMYGKSFIDVDTRFQQRMNYWSEKQNRVQDHGNSPISVLKVMDRKPTLVRNFVVKISNFIILFSFRRQYIVTIFYPPIKENKVLNLLFLEGIPCIPCLFLCFLSRKFEKKVKRRTKLT